MPQIPEGIVGRLPAADDVSIPVQTQLIVELCDDVLDQVVRRACADNPDACKRVPPDATVYEKAQRMTRR